MQKLVGGRAKLLVVVILVVGIASVFFENENLMTPKSINRLTVNHKNNNGANDVDNTTSTNYQNTILQQNHNYDADVSLMIGLSGEFGNHVDKMIRGWGIALLAKDEYNITSHIILKQQTSSGSTHPVTKARVSQQYLQQCFQHLQNQDFELGNTIKQNYIDLFDEPNHIALDGSIDSIRENLSKLKDYLKSPSKGHFILPSTQNKSQNNINLPKLPPIIVESNNFGGYPFVDQYYDEVRQLFAFNNSVCCNEIPDPDESVFVSSAVLIFAYVWFMVIFIFNI
jgi:hypothetical protein